jgi:dihydroorotate dehydrogenase (fumarate)
MELANGYMGLALRNPLVASASPLSRTVDEVRRLADAGVGAVVLFSLFEEQLLREAEQNTRLADAGAESLPSRCPTSLSRPRRRSARGAT